MYDIKTFWDYASIIPLFSFVVEYPNLVKFCYKIREQIWADWNLEIDAQGPTELESLHIMRKPSSEHGPEPERTDFETCDEGDEPVFTLSPRRKDPSPSQHHRRSRQAYFSDKFSIKGSSRPRSKDASRTRQRYQHQTR
jgi:hypothetical protein